MSLWLYNDRRERPSCGSERMITTNSTSCKHHGEKMKRTCPGCLTVEITRLRKERDYYKAQYDGCVVCQEMM